MKVYNFNEINSNNWIDPFRSSKILHSRRNFLVDSFKAIVIFNIGLITSCKEFSVENDFLSEKEIKIFNAILEFLWPDDGNGPSVKQAKVPEYLLQNIGDKSFDPEEKQYFKDGIRWIEETSNEEYGIEFSQLQEQNHKALFQLIADTDWGEAWYSNLISMILEAVLADPIYGSNPEGISFQWLNHDPGLPRPSEKNNYNALLKKKNEELIVKSMSDIF